MRWGWRSGPLSPGRTLGDTCDRFPNHDGSAVPARPGEPEIAMIGVAFGILMADGDLFVAPHAEANGAFGGGDHFFFCVPFLP